MIRTLLTLKVKPESIGTARRYFQDNRVIERALAYGMLRGELVTADGAANTMVSAAIWPDLQAYAQWQAAPERKRLVDGMAAFLVRADALNGSIEDLASPLIDLANTPISVESAFRSGGGHTVTRLHCVISPPTNKITHTETP